MHHENLPVSNWYPQINVTHFVFAQNVCCVSILGIPMFRSNNYFLLSAFLQNYDASNNVFSLTTLGVFIIMS